jgi:hypothetical protein
MVKPPSDNNPQATIKRLAERWAQAERSPVDCQLGANSLRRRGGGCANCAPPDEYELDRAIAELINARIFRRATECPYTIVTSHLLAGLAFAPEAFRARSSGQQLVDPVLELKGAVARVRRVLGATRLAAEDIEALSEQGGKWAALYEVLSADRALHKALDWFIAEIPQQSRLARGGRTGALDVQALTRAMALAWRNLTGRLPGKDNTNFLDLLSAAHATVFGQRAREPNWEAATRRTLKHIKNG